MKKTIIKMIIVSIVFFIGTVSIISLDNICLETMLIIKAFSSKIRSIEF